MIINPSTVNDPVLRVNNLSTHFKTESGVVKAVDNVSFTLNRGETLGIVGESGSGKSVTCLSVMQLINDPPGKITTGEILFDSYRLGKVDLRKLPEKDLRKIRGNDIAMIFQEPMSSLNPVFTCGDQVVEAIKIHQHLKYAEAKELCLELFKEVQLQQPELIFSAYPHQLSGGQKQRVMIAMALSCNPSVIIADEPTTALDVTVQANILKLLRNLRDEKHTSTIFISHDLAVIAEIADRVIVMYQGRIVEEGTVWEIFANPKHPYTKGLLACRPRMDIRLKVLPTISDFMELDATGNIVEKKNAYRSVGEAILKNAESSEELSERRKKLKSQKPLLEVRNLKTYFPVRRGLFRLSKDWIKAVDDVSFEVYPGETLGLVGESGCGKTTLGRSILRLIEPTKGNILFAEKDITSLSHKELRELRKEMQIIFQDPYSALNPRMSIGNAIMEPMYIHKLGKDKRERTEKAYDLLEKVGLNPEYFHRFPHELSGGQRQRVCIARALALHPRFIICDESVSALDVSVQAQVLNLLNLLKKEFNFTYIFISHDLSVVKFISDRIMVMHQGKIIESGYPDEIYRNPKEAYTQELISAIPKGDLEGIRKNMLKNRLEKASYTNKDNHE